MEKVLKRIGIIIVILLSLAALCADLIYGYIKFFAPDRSINITLEGGTLKNVEAENLKYIFNLRYYRNKDNSGIELYELMLNSFIDEKTEEVYSTGIQVVNPTFGVYQDETRKWFTDNVVAKSYVLPFYQYNQYQNNSYVDDSYTNANSSSEAAALKCGALYNDTYFLITLGDDVYKLKFKNEVEEYVRKNAMFVQGIGDRQINFMWFFQEIYKSARSLTPGINQKLLFKFSDYFKYQKLNENGSYDDLESKSEDYALIDTELTSYYVIKADIYDYGATQANESLFHSIRGQYNYNISKNKLSEDYFISKTTIALNENYFIFDYNDELNKHIVILKDGALNYYKDKDNIMFDILLDLDKLNALNIYELVVEKSTLNFGKYELHKVETCMTTIDGRVVREVIDVK